MRDLPECFQPFTGFSGGSLRWNGVLRSGTFTPEQAITLCRKLQNGEIDRLFKDSSKIKAGIVDGFFVKMYKLPGISAQLRRRFRMGRAMISLLAAEAVRRAGVATPQVKAALKMVSGFHICDFIITEALDDQEMTFNYCMRSFSGAEQDDWLINHILPAVTTLHQHGISHGDLNLRNIYCTAAAPAEEKSVGVIDLDGAKTKNSALDTNEREYELARLCSGFCRTCHRKGCQEIIEVLLAKYEQLCGVRCDNRNVLKRADYLFTRLH